MSDFVNTADVIGDAALLDSIVDRTVSEMADSRVEKVGDYAFQDCKSLAMVDFPSATSIGAYAFHNCSALSSVNIPNVKTIGEYGLTSCAFTSLVLPAVTTINKNGLRLCASLKTLDLHSAVKFVAFSLYGTSALSALILRSSTLCTLEATSAFNSSGIAGGTGYIYVPASLVDSYKAASNWSTYAAQIRAIEDYPEICDPYSWEAVSKHIEAGTYKDAYKVGDCVPLDLGSEGVVNMQIAAFDKDKLADGSGTAAITWIAKDLLKTSRTMADPNNAGWGGSGLRTALQTEILPLVPENVSSQIVSVSHSYRIYTSSTISYPTCNDELWIPCKTEIFGTGAYTALFPDDASRVKKIPGVSSTQEWWTRYHEAEGRYQFVDDDGDYSTMGYQGQTRAVCLGFCTGVTPVAWVPLTADGTWMGEEVTTTGGKANNFAAQALDIGTRVRVEVDGVVTEGELEYVAPNENSRFPGLLDSNGNIVLMHDPYDNYTEVVVGAAGTYTIKVEVAT